MVIQSLLFLQHRAAKRITKYIRMVKQTITSTPFPRSRKIYVEGDLFPIKVAMREISLSPTRLSNGSTEINPPITVYDSSGPYTDEQVVINVRKGLPRLREQWILDRNDVDVLPDVSSRFGRERLADRSLDTLRFSYNHKPKAAKSGHNVTQLHYARKGIITPEMEYVAIRENQRIEQLQEATQGME